jgi:hypothetical protein
MGRIRTIKPDFPQSQTVTTLSRDARLLYIQLWTIADDEGRAVGAPGIVASLLYPLDADARGLVEEWLSELERAGCIRCYEVDGKLYLDLPNWLKHQKIDRPSPSKLPAYSSNPRRTFDERSATPRSNSTVSGREGTGTGNGTGTGTFPVALAPSEPRAPLEAPRARSASKRPDLQEAIAQIRKRPRDQWTDGEVALVRDFGS